MATRYPLTPQYQRELTDAAEKLSAYVQGPAAKAIAARLAFWRSLQQSMGAFGAAAERQVRAMFPAEVAGNVAADADAKAYAELLAGLRNGQYQLTAWAVDPAKAVTFGVTRAGAAAGELGFPFVPVLFVVGSAVVAGGAWVVADLFGTAQKTAAEAELVRAQTAAKIQDAVAAVAKQDPAAATALADSLTRAQQAANNATPGFLDRLLQGVTGAVESVTGGGGGLIIVLGLLLGARLLGGRGSS